VRQTCTQDVLPLLSETLDLSLCNSQRKKRSNVFRGADVMSNFGQQFNGMAHPRPRGGDRGVTRRPTEVADHPEHGKVGSLSAVARELGVAPAALGMQKRRRADFPEPILGNVYRVDDIKNFRGD